MELMHGETESSPQQAGATSMPSIDARAVPGSPGRWGGRLGEQPAGSPASARS